MTGLTKHRQAKALQTIVGAGRSATIEDLTDAHHTLIRRLEKLMSTAMSDGILVRGDTPLVLTFKANEVGATLVFEIPAIGGSPDTDRTVYVARAWGGLAEPVADAESYLIGVYATLDEAKAAADEKFESTPEWEDVCEVGDPPCSWAATFSDYWSVMIEPATLAADVQ